MAHEWPTKRLSELGEVNRGRSRHRPRYAEHLYGGKYPFIQTGDIKASHGKITSYQQTYSEAGLAQSRLWPAGTLCITIAANIAETGILSFPACFPDSVVGFIADQSKCETQFIEYMFRHLRRRIQQEATGSVQDNINLETLNRLEIPLPPLPEQRGIVSVLAALDDKMDLNRRINDTLKVMMQNLFKSWFLNFSPVQIKASGKKPLDLDADTAKLFPAAFQDSVIGPVPKGWKVERFDAHITAERGLSYNGEGLRDDCTGLPMHNLNSIYEGGGYKHEGIKYYAGEFREKHLLKPGDMIVTNTEQGFDHLLIGHAAIVPERYGTKGIYSHHIYRVRHKPSSPFSSHYLVELFNSPRWHYWISGFSNGTTINMLPKDALDMPYLVVPPVELIEKFTALADAAHSQVEANLEQSCTLATLRDTLLPKLLSGELRVPQAKQPQVKQAELNIVQLPIPRTKPARKTTDEFVEAVMIAQLVRLAATPQFPLGRKRYNKYAYLAHRKAEDDVTEHYLKKAAGPYSPWAKYQGPEGIACKNGYIKNVKVGQLAGFVPGDKVAQIDRYLAKYPCCAAVEWVVAKFKFRKNDDLELLATVDYAALDLMGRKEPVSFEGVKHVIATNKEWAAKLKREIFSDANIQRALTELLTVFPGTYAT